MNNDVQKTTVVHSSSFDEDIGPNLSFAAAEAYKLLRTSLMFSLPGDGERCRIVGVTSANAGEGKSTTALNLSYMLAEADQRVVLIEADMRLPSITKRLGISKSPGLSNVLAGLGGKKVVQHSGLSERLKVISSGDIPPNPSELLGSENMKTMLDLIAQNADFIILDLPPIGEVSDALVVSRFTDGMLMVVRENYANRRALSSAMLNLENVNAKVLGFVVTDSDSFNKGKYKYKKKYKNKYGYGYGHRYGYDHSYADVVSSENKQ